MNLDSLLDTVVLLDQGGEHAVSASELLEKVVPSLISGMAFARAYRLMGTKAFLQGTTYAGADFELDQQVDYARVMQRREPLPVGDQIWAAPLYLGDEPFGLLEVGFETPTAGRTAEQMRLAAAVLTPPLYTIFNRSDELKFRADDALSLVQGQYETTGAIFGTDNLVDVMRSINKFVGVQFDQLQLALLDNPDQPSRLHVIVEGDSRGIRAADLVMQIEDIPAYESLTAVDALLVSDANDDPFLMEDERARLLADSIQSMLLVPLIANQRQIGLISFKHSAAARVSQARLRALRSLADQLAVVLENKSLLKETQVAAEQLGRQVRVLEALNQLATSSSTSRDEKTLLDQSLRSVVGALGVDHGAVLLLEGEERVGVVVSEYPYTGALGQRLNPEDNLAMQAVSSEPVVLQPVATDPQLSDDLRQRILALGLEATMVLPLVVRGEIIGSVGLDFRTSGKEFTPEMIETGQTMAAQISIGLQNIRLLTDTQRRAEQLQRIAGFGQAVQMTLDMQAILNIMLVETLQTIPFDRMQIALYDAARDRLRVVAQHGEGRSSVNLDSAVVLPLERGYFADAWQRQELRHFSNLLSENWDDSGDYRSLIVAPLRSRGRRLGLISVASIRPYAYSGTDIAVFQQMTNQLAVAIENAETYAQSQRVARAEALVNEISARLQQQTDVQQALEAVVNDLGEALQARRGRIRLALPSQQSVEN